MFHSRFRHAWQILLIAALVSHASGVFAIEAMPRVAPVPADIDTSGFGEGWEASVDYPVIEGVSDNNLVCRLWVDQGWLHVERRSEEGLEWRLALAEIEQGVYPVVSVFESVPALEVSYDNRRYAVRDNSVVVRAIRQRSDDRPTFVPQGLVPADQQAQRGYSQSLSGFIFSGWELGSWFCVGSGPDSKQWDTFVRLNPTQLVEPGHGFGSMLDGLAQAHHGETWAYDDGELLIAEYRAAALARAALAQKRIRENLPGSEPPVITASKWLNTTGPLDRSAFDGKVVLIDFWATSCGGCIAKMPEVQKLHEAYADDGLLVIGVHTESGGETCEPFLAKRGFTYPIAIDTGETAVAYGVSGLPTYFLVDRGGKVVTGYSSRLPSEEEIQRLLAE
ncbi:MAG: TlpA disulfide reductase family protein [Planctomycetota bacterium]